MIESILLAFAVILTALGYGFKLDFLKFIAGVIFVIAGYYMAYYLTWFGSIQWVFLVIGAFGLAVPLWIHTIWTMSLNRKTKMQEKAKAMYTEGDNDEIDQEYETDRKEFDRMTKRYPTKQTVRSKRRNALFGR